MLAALARCRVSCRGATRERTVACACFSPHCGRRPLPKRPPPSPASPGSILFQRGNAATLLSKRHNHDPSPASKERMGPSHAAVCPIETHLATGACASAVHAHGADTDAQVARRAPHDVSPVPTAPATSEASWQRWARRLHCMHRRPAITLPPRPPPMPMPPPPVPPPPATHPLAPPAATPLRP